LLFWRLSSEKQSKQILGHHSKLKENVRAGKQNIHACAGHIAPRPSPADFVLSSTGRVHRESQAFAAPSPTLTVTLSTLLDGKVPQRGSGVVPAAPGGLLACPNNNI